MRVLRAAAAVLGAAAALALAGCETSELPGFEREERALFPELERRLEEVTGLGIEGARSTFTLTRRDGSWSVAEKDGYPAQGDKVEALLQELAGLRSVYASTEDSLRYADYGLGGPEHPNSSRVRIALKTAGDAVLVEVDLGHTVTTPAGSQVFLRRSGQERVWVADSELHVSADPMAWIDEALMDIPREQVREVTLTDPQGEELVVQRSPEGALELTQGPQESTPADVEAMASSVTGALERLAFEDVRSAPPLAEVPAGHRATFRTFDGLRISLRVIDRDDERWTLVDASSAPGDRESGAGGQGAARQEIARISQKTAGWAFRLPIHVTELLTRGARSLWEATSPPEEVEGVSADDR